MNRTDHDSFWDRYDREVRPGIERACRHASRTLSGSTMDPDDMIEWVHTKVWRMLERDASPTFHDDPSVDDAIDRLSTHTPTLARWAYLALCRKHYRRLENRAQYQESMTRAQRLAMSRSAPEKLTKREDLDAAIEALRDKLTDDDKQKLAASWIDPEDRKRVAAVLGATRREDDRMITKANGGGMKANTIEQMRSRAKKKAAAVLRKSGTLPLIGFLVLTAALAAVPSAAFAGEQTGGRRGIMTPDVATDDEQSGGRAGMALFSEDG